jgi:cob(I)alamin adenosyltransferase
MEDDGQSLGMVHVYTGDGKGKTTAALGLALRAVGHNMKVHMIQFMKGDINYGELKAARDIPNLEIVQFGNPTFVNKENPSQDDIELAQLGFEHAKIVVAEGLYDLVILDELSVAIDFNLVGLEDVLKLIESKPTHVELVITGRNAHEKIIERADLVTNMQKVKHYYDKGIESRKGIEH